MNTTTTILNPRLKYKPCELCAEVSIPEKQLLRKYCKACGRRAERIYMKGYYDGREFHKKKLIK